MTENTAAASDLPHKITSDAPAEVQDQSPRENEGGTLEKEEVGVRMILSMVRKTKYDIRQIWMCRYGYYAMEGSKHHGRQPTFKNAPLRRPYS